MIARFPALKFVQLSVKNLQRTFGVTNPLKSGKVIYDRLTHIMGINILYIQISYVASVQKLSTLPEVPQKNP